MKIKKGFVLRPTLGYTVVVATGELAGKFKGMIKLNDSGADIWRWIEEGLEREDIIARYSEVYAVEKVVAEADVDEMIENMTKADVLEK